MKIKKLAINQNLEFIFWWKIKVQNLYFGIYWRKYTDRSLLDADEIEIDKNEIEILEIYICIIPCIPFTINRFRKLK